jgi:hypothetical protein
MSNFLIILLYCFSQILLIEVAHSQIRLSQAALSKKTPSQKIPNQTIPNQTSRANELICFMKTSNGQFIDLSSLCGRKSQPIIRRDPTDLGFAKDLAEAIAGYPLEQEILKKVNPKVFEAEARKICEKLRDGTFTEYRDQVAAPPISSSASLETTSERQRNNQTPSDRQQVITNISFNLSKELGTKYFCTEFKD